MLQVELEFGALFFLSMHSAVGVLKLEFLSTFVRLLSLKILSVIEGKVHYQIVYIIYYVMF